MLCFQVTVHGWIYYFRQLPRSGARLLTGITGGGDNEAFYARSSPASHCELKARTGKQRKEQS